MIDTTVIPGTDDFKDEIRKDFDRYVADVAEALEIKKVMHDDIILRYDAWWSDYSVRQVVMAELKQFISRHARLKKEYAKKCRECDGLRQIGLPLEGGKQS